MTLSTGSKQAAEKTNFSTVSSCCSVLNFISLLLKFSKMKMLIHARYLGFSFSLFAMCVRWLSGMSKTLIASKWKKLEERKSCDERSRKKTLCRREKTFCKKKEKMRWPDTIYFFAKIPLFIFRSFEFRVFRVHFLLLSLSAIPINSNFIWLVTFFLSALLHFFSPHSFRTQQKNLRKSFLETLRAGILVNFAPAALNPKKKQQIMLEFDGEKKEREKGNVAEKFLCVHNEKINMFWLTNRFYSGEFSWISFSFSLSALSHSQLKHAKSCCLRSRKDGKVAN